MTETFFKPTDDLDPEGIQAEMGKRAKAQKKQEEDDENGDEAVNFPATPGNFDPRPMKTPRQRRPRMGK